MRPRVLDWITCSGNFGFETCVGHCCSIERVLVQDPLEIRLRNNTVLKCFHAILLSFVGILLDWNSLITSAWPLEIHLRQWSLPLWCLQNWETFVRMPSLNNTLQLRIGIEHPWLDSGFLKLSSIILEHWELRDWHPIQWWSTDWSTFILLIRVNFLNRVRSCVYSCPANKIRKLILVLPVMVAFHADFRFAWRHPL